ncbi:hypothetical protein AMR72_16375 [Flavobacterium psychrophilum]|nr:hypothetical protein AMR72_16375 [Flavobacterium psychrophilum]AOE53940.1 hypothetical protein ALW18_16365 [Flavobacterium psychrophilum]
MCYKIQEPELPFAEKQFNARFGRPEAFNPKKYLFGFDHPECAIILDENPNEIIMGTWGLVPAWGARKDRKEFYKTANTLNAKVEEAHQKASYKDSVTKHCLILAESFIEYKHVPMIGKQAVDKVPYRITAKDGKPFAIAGLYNVVGNEVTFTLLTTSANTLMAEIHNSAKRMPVVLHRDEEQQWLRNDILEPYHSRTEIELDAKIFHLNNGPGQIDLFNAG